MLLSVPDSGKLKLLIDLPIGSCSNLLQLVSEDKKVHWRINILVCMLQPLFRPILKQPCYIPQQTWNSSAKDQVYVYQYISFYFFQGDGTFEGSGSEFVSPIFHI